MSVVNFSQIFTVDKTRFTDFVSMLPQNYMSKINESIRYIFSTEIYIKSHAVLLLR